MKTSALKLVVSEGVNNQHQTALGVVGIQMHSDVYMYNVFLLETNHCQIAWVHGFSL